VIGGDNAPTLATVVNFPEEHLSKKFIAKVWLTSGYLRKNTLDPTFWCTEIRDGSVPASSATHHGATYLLKNVLNFVITNKDQAKELIRDLRPDFYHLYTLEFTVRRMTSLQRSWYVTEISSITKN